MTDEESLFRALEHDISTDLHSIPLPHYYMVKAIFISDQDPEQREARLVPGTLSTSITEVQRSMRFFMEGEPGQVAISLTMMAPDLALSYDRLWRIWAVGLVEIKTETAPEGS